MVVSVHETQEECYFEDFMPLSGQNICFHALKVGLRVDFDEEKFQRKFFSQSKSQIYSWKSLLRSIYFNFRKLLDFDISKTIDTIVGLGLWS